MIRFEIDSFGSRFPGFHVQHAQLDSDFAYHTHDFDELVVISRGSATHTIEGAEYRVEAGDVYVLTAGVGHGFSEVRGLSLYNLMFVPELPQTITPSLARFAPYQALFTAEPRLRGAQEFQGRLRLSRDQLSSVTELCKTLLGLYSRCGSRGFDMIGTVLASICMYLASCYDAGAHQAYSKQALLVGKATAHIHAGFSEPISVTDIAEAAGVSVRHLTRLFRAVHQSSPANYLSTVRLAKAADLLRTTDDTVTEIAFACGFNDGSYFAKVFAKRFGLPPRQYRFG